MQSGPGLVKACNIPAWKFLLDASKRAVYQIAVLEDEQDCRRLDIPVPPGANSSSKALDICLPGLGTVKIAQILHWQKWRTAASSAYVQPGDS